MLKKLAFLFCQVFDATPTKEVFFCLMNPPEGGGRNTCGHHCSMATHPLPEEPMTVFVGGSFCWAPQPPVVNQAELTNPETPQQGWGSRSALGWTPGCGPQTAFSQPSAPSAERPDSSGAQRILVWVVCEKIGLWFETRTSASAFSFSPATPGLLDRSGQTLFTSRPHPLEP